MVAGAEKVTHYEDQVAHFLVQSLSLDPLLLVSTCRPTYLRYSHHGAQDREESGLEGVLEHGCGSGRSDSRPLRASGPGAHGWERQQERARAGMRYAMR